MWRGKRVFQVMLIVILIVGCIFCLFCRFEKLDYDIDHLESVELYIMGDFDTTILTDREDMETLMDSINSSKTAIPKIGLPSGGYNLYEIDFNFKDGHKESFSFVSDAWDADERNSKMERVDAGLFSRFKGNLEFIFFDLVKKINPTEKNMEWYDAFYERVEVK